MDRKAEKIKAKGKEHIRKETCLNDAIINFYDSFKKTQDSWVCALK